MVHDQAERAELVFLPLAVALPQFTALAVKGDAGELMATLAAIQLSENAAAVIRVIDIGEQVKRLRNASQFSGWPWRAWGFLQEPSKGYIREFMGLKQRNYRLKYL